MTNKQQITYRSVESLIPYANNSRTHDDAQVAQIAASIKEFGWTNPLLVDGDNGIIAGHGRLLAARKLGMDDVPCIELAGLTDLQRKAYIIADNKLALNAGWDDELLAIEFAELSNAGFDNLLTGFSQDEIDALSPEQIPEGLTDEDAVPDVTEIPHTVLGDVWLLGKHRVMCGDSTSIDSVEKLLGGGRADMLFTDPPYLMDFTGGIHADGSKSFNASHGSIKNDKMSEKDGETFLDAINFNIKKFVFGSFYISFYRLGIDKYFNSLSRVGMQCRSLIIWDKGNHTLSNSDYMSMYEPIFYGWIDAHHFFGGNNGVDIWPVKRTQKNELHPTMKPVELVEKCILNSSKKNQIVLDIFGGSGTTLIAAEKNNRVAMLMELDPKYCDVIVKRWQEFTGKKATHADTGLEFPE